MDQVFALCSEKIRRYGVIGAGVIPSPLTTIQLAEELRLPENTEESFKHLSAFGLEISDGECTPDEWRHHNGSEYGENTSTTVVSEAEEEKDAVDFQKFFKEKYSEEKADDAKQDGDDEEELEYSNDVVEEEQTQVFDALVIERELTGEATEEVAMQPEAECSLDAEEEEAESQLEDVAIQAAEVRIQDVSNGEATSHGSIDRSKPTHEVHVSETLDKSQEPARLAKPDCGENAPEEQIVESPQADADEPVEELPEEIRSRFELETGAVKSLSKPKARLKLRDIEAETGAHLTFDKAERVIWLTGTQESVDAATERLNVMYGDSEQRVVTPGNGVHWVVLSSRTDPAGWLNKLETQSGGCKVNVDRNEARITLQGSEAALTSAEAMLQVLAAECSELVLFAPDKKSRETWSPLVEGVEQDTGARCRWNVKDGSVTVFGITEKVEEASKKLREDLGALEERPPPTPKPKKIKEKLVEPKACASSECAVGSHGCDQSEPEAETAPEGQASFMGHQGVGCAGWTGLPTGMWPMAHQQQLIQMVPVMHVGENGEPIEVDPSSMQWAVQDEEGNLVPMIPVYDGFGGSCMMMPHRMPSVGGKADESSGMLLSPDMRPIACVQGMPGAYCNMMNPYGNIQRQGAPPEVRFDPVPLCLRGIHPGVHAGIPSSILQVLLGVEPLVQLLVSLPPQCSRQRPTLRTLGFAVDYFYRPAAQATKAELLEVSKLFQPVVNAFYRQRRSTSDPNEPAAFMRFVLQQLHLETRWGLEEPPSFQNSDGPVLQVEGSAARRIFGGSHLVTWASSDQRWSLRPFEVLRVDVPAHGTNTLKTLIGLSAPGTANGSDPIVHGICTAPPVLVVLLHHCSARGVRENCRVHFDLELSVPTKEPSGNTVDVLYDLCGAVFRGQKQAGNAFAAVRHGMDWWWFRESTVQCAHIKDVLAQQHDVRVVVYTRRGCAAVDLRPPREEDALQFWMGPAQA